jgi:hypothetical protein
VLQALNPDSSQGYPQDDQEGHEVSKIEVQLPQPGAMG